ncbi:MAG: stage II sporulation protein M [Nanoarchaeota archaeon]|nr:stage II sporulation protein M [Nanoarchaeota archaeon]
MVLESLITPLAAERKPWDMFFIGIFYSTIAMFLGLWIFYEQSSLVMVFLTSLACVPLIFHAIRREEKNEDHKKEVILLKEHSRVICFLVCLFFGFIISFSLWYVFLPAHMTETMFATQIQTISAINAKISGSAATIGSFVGIGAIRDLTGELTSDQLFWKILENNVKVLMFCIFFSFFYGSGAIFILTWNASVISAAIGNFVRTNLSTVTGIGYFSIFSIGVFRYMTHGVFEILAYFMGALAGGIISVAVIRHELGTKQFKHVLLDSVDVILLATGVLFLAAFVEVYITPALF